MYSLGSFSVGVRSMLAPEAKWQQVLQRHRQIQMRSLSENTFTFRDFTEELARQTNGMLNTTEDRALIGWRIKCKEPVLAPTALLLSM